jgi:hypothetical protein
MRVVCLLDVGQVLLGRTRGTRRRYGGLWRGRQPGAHRRVREAAGGPRFSLRVRARRHPGKEAHDLCPRAPYRGQLLVELQLRCRVRALVTAHWHRPLRCSQLHQWQWRWWPKRLLFPPHPLQPPPRGRPVAQREAGCRLSKPRRPELPQARVSACRLRDPRAPRLRL